MTTTVQIKHVSGTSRVRVYRNSNALLNGELCPFRQLLAEFGPGDELSVYFWDANNLVFEEVEEVAFVVRPTTQ